MLALRGRGLYDAGGGPPGAGRETPLPAGDVCPRFPACSPPPCPWSWPPRRWATGRPARTPSATRFPTAPSCASGRPASCADGAARLSPDGKLIAVGDRAGAVRLLDAADGTEVRRIQVEQFGGTTAAFSPSGDVLAVTSLTDDISFWDPATGKSLGRIGARQNGQSSLTFSADGKTVIVAPRFLFNQKAGLHAYEVPGGKEIGSYPTIQDSQIGAALSADGKTAASWGVVGLGGVGGQPDAARTVQFWDVAAGKELRRVQSDHGTVGAAAFSPDGKTLALACDAGAVELWDPAQGKLLQTFLGRGAYGSRTTLLLTFSPDGKTLLDGGADGRVQAWDLPAGRLETAEPPAASLCSLAFPAGGPVLACSQNAQELRVWEVLPGKAPAPRVGHAAQVSAVGFTADGKRLWSAGEDGEVVQWDAVSGKERAPHRRRAAGERRAAAFPAARLRPPVLPGRPLLLPPQGSQLGSQPARVGDQPGSHGTARPEQPGLRRGRPRGLFAGRLGGRRRGVRAEAHRRRQCLPVRPRFRQGVVRAQGVQRPRLRPGRFSRRQDAGPGPVGGVSRAAESAAGGARVDGRQGQGAAAPFATRCRRPTTAG